MSCPTNVAAQLQQVMVQLKRGVGYITSDHDTAAKFILAAIKADKQDNYNFSPTLLNESEWVGFLKSVVTLPPPAQEKFIIMGAHWTAGEIEVLDNGKVNIFLSDSLGCNVNGLGYFFKDLINSIESHQALNNHVVDIYYPLNVRQNNSQGCSFYALDDVRHFHTMERYMTGQTLFSSLENTEKKIIPIATHIQLKICPLPDALLRTTQSRSVLDRLQNDVINKKGKLSKQSTESFFSLNPSTQKMENQRLNYKAQKMIDRIDHHFLNIIQSDDPQKNLDKFMVMTNEHSFSAFQIRAARLASENRANPERGSSISIESPNINRSESVVKTKETVVSDVQLCINKTVAFKKEIIARTLSESQNLNTTYPKIK